MNSPSTTISGFFTLMIADKKVRTIRDSYDVAKVSMIVIYLILPIFNKLARPNDDIVQGVCC